MHTLTQQNSPMNLPYKQKAMYKSPCASFLVLHPDLPVNALAGGKVQLGAASAHIAERSAPVVALLAAVLSRVLRSGELQVGLRVGGREGELQWLEEAALLRRQLLVDALLKVGDGEDGRHRVVKVHEHLTALHRPAAQPSHLVDVAEEAEVAANHLCPRRRPNALHADALVVPQVGGQVGRLH